MVQAKKTYGQFCGLARALDHIGDRWTLLVVRELLLGRSTYGSLLQALNGIPTNLLAERLRDLEADGLVTRQRHPDDARRVVYELTALGAQLEPAILALIRWGAHWMASGQGQDDFNPRWAALAVRALLEGRRFDSTGSVELHMDGEVLTVSTVEGEPVRVEAGPSPADPQARVSGSGEVILGLLSGRLALAEASQRGVRIAGQRTRVRELIRVPN